MLITTPINKLAQGEYIFRIDDSSVEQDGLCCYDGDNRGWVQINEVTDSSIQKLDFDGQFLNNDGNKVSFMEFSLYLGPTPEPSSMPSAVPSVSLSPSAEPSTVPSTNPTAYPTRQPTPLPTPLPTPIPNFGQIQGKHDYKCLQYQSDGNIIVESCISGSWNQQFKYDRNTRQIRTKTGPSDTGFNGGCMNADIGSESSTPNPNVNIHGCSTAYSWQRWYMDSSERLKHEENSGECMDDDLSTARNVYMHSCHSDPNQKWIVPPRFWDG